MIEKNEIPKPISFTPNLYKLARTKWTTFLISPIALASDSV